MTKTIIHVNQHVIRSNTKNAERKPTLTVKQGRTNTYAQEVVIDGPSKVVYRPDKPLKCGARVWIETTAPVTLVGAKSLPKWKCPIKYPGCEKNCGSYGCGN
jgi:hypothetical protein